MARLRPLLAALVLALPACLAAGVAAAGPASPDSGGGEPAIAAVDRRRDHVWSAAARSQPRAFPA